MLAERRIEGAPLDEEERESAMTMSSREIARRDEPDTDDDERSCSAFLGQNNVTQSAGDAGGGLSDSEDDLPYHEVVRRRASSVSVSARHEVVRRRASSVSVSARTDEYDALPLECAPRQRAPAPSTPPPSSPAAPVTTSPRGGGAAPPRAPLERDDDGGTTRFAAGRQARASPLKRRRLYADPRLLKCCRTRGRRKDEEVRRLLESGCRVDDVDDNGLTALHLAAFHGIAGVVRALVDNGAPLELTTQKNLNILHWATGAGGCDDGYDFVVALVEAAPRAVIRRLCKAQDEQEGMTPLNRAVLNRHEKLAMLLGALEVDEDERIDGMLARAKAPVAARAAAAPPAQTAAPPPQHSPSSSSPAPTAQAQLTELSQYFGLDATPETRRTSTPEPRPAAPPSSSTPPPAPARRPNRSRPIPRDAQVFEIDDSDSDDPLRGLPPPPPRSGARREAPIVID